MIARKGGYVGVYIFICRPPIIFKGGFGRFLPPMISTCRITYIMEGNLTVLFLLSY
jgi:hypothetical protein